MDAVDIQILEILQEDAFLPAKKISKMNPVLALKGKLQ